MVEVVPDKGVIGKKYRKEAKPLLEWLGELPKTDIEQLERQLADKGYIMCGYGWSRIHDHVTVM